MPALLAVTQPFADIPPAFWIWGAMTCFFAAAMGFVAGFLFARNSVNRALDRAKRHVSKLYSLVVESLDHAEEACGVLEKFPGLQLSNQQVDKLKGKKEQIAGVMSDIVTKQSERLATVAKKQEENARLVTEQLASGWVREPADPTTGIPGRSAFEANLQKLLEFGTRTESESGLLLVRLDKLEQHKARYGVIGIEKFVKTFASIACRALRENDIVCRCRPDTLGVLFANVDAETGRRLSAAMRTNIRGHQFRLVETGPEILVTASFGYTRCLPHDTVELALNRADSALVRSSRRGRNQLHVHDGDELTHFAAT